MDTFLGPSQLICYEDLKKLPYTNAVVCEMQHFSNIVFVGMSRVCVRDTTLLGFPIKKVQTHFQPLFFLQQRYLAFISV